MRLATSSVVTLWVYLLFFFLNLTTQNQQKINIFYFLTVLKVYLKHHFPTQPVDVERLLSMTHSVTAEKIVESVKQIHEVKYFQIYNKRKGRKNPNIYLIKI